jgi:hypothetical protein
MNAWTVGLITFACICAGAALGMALQQVLPEHHLRESSKDVVKLVSGLIATLSALVLGLLVASSKSSFDAVNDGFKDGAARVLLLDRVLAQYGPAAKEVREQLRAAVAGQLRALFPDEAGAGAAVDALRGSMAVESVQTRVRALVPATDAERELKSRAQQILGDLAQSRWLGYERTESATPPAFLVVLVSWLSLMFVSFGLFAPRHATAIIALFVGAFSLSTAIFLIEEMNRPLDGVIAVSSAPLRNALGLLGK